MTVDDKKNSLDDAAQSAPLNQTQPPSQQQQATVQSAVIIHSPSAPNYNQEQQSFTNLNQMQSNNNNNMAPPPPYYEPLPVLHPVTTVIQPSGGFMIGLPFSMPISVGSSPSRLRCPNCSADIVTQTKHKSGCMAWALCGTICVIGLFAPCAWLGCQVIPFCIDSCKDVEHRCPNCRAYIATFDRMR